MSDSTGSIKHNLRVQVKTQRFVMGEEHYIIFLHLSIAVHVGDI